MTFHIVSFGDLVIDLVMEIASLPVEAGRDQLVRQTQFEPGGAGNFLIAGSRLGMHVSALAAVGDDPLGGPVLEILKSEGVDIHDVVRQAGGTTTTVLVLVDRTGGHVFLGQFGEGEDLPLLENWKAALRQADAAQFWGYTLQEERLTKAMVAAMKYARSQHVPVFFDPGPQMTGATPAAVAEILSHTDVLTLTEAEAAALTGGKAGEAGAHALLALGPREVVVKSGAQGCVRYDVDGCVHHPGFAVPLRDTTGAGDSFAAALMYAWLRRWPARDVLAFANAMGAAKVQKLGSGRQVPTADEVRAVLRANGVALDF